MMIRTTLGAIVIAFYKKILRKCEISVTVLTTLLFSMSLSLDNPFWSARSLSFNICSCCCLINSCLSCICFFSNSSRFSLCSSISRSVSASCSSCNFCSCISLLCCSWTTLSFRTTTSAGLPEPLSSTYKFNKISCYLSYYHQTRYCIPECTMGRKQISKQQCSLFTINCRK